MNQNHQREKKQVAVIMRYMIAAAIILLLIIYSGEIFTLAGSLWNIILPMVLGGAMAYVLNVIMSKWEKVYFPNSQRLFIRKSRFTVILLLSILSVLAVIVFVIGLVVPELGRTITTLAGTIPEYWDQIILFLTNYQDYPVVADMLEQLEINWDDVGKQIIGYATQGMGGIVNSAVSGVGGIVNSAFSVVSGFASGLFSFFIAFSFSIYILAGKNQIKLQMKRVAGAFLPRKWLHVAGVILKVADQCFSSFIIGQLTEALILGGLCTLGMLLFRFPYATAVGAFVGVTALIPVFGAWIGAGVGALLIFVVSPVKALLFFIFIVVLQQVENNLIYPRIVGTSIGLPGIWVLAAITIGGGFGGVAGMLISVPLSATLYKLLKLAVNARLEHIARTEKEGKA